MESPRRLKLTKARWELLFVMYHKPDVPLVYAQGIWTFDGERVSRGVKDFIFQGWIEITADFTPEETTAHKRKILHYQLTTAGKREFEARRGYMPAPKERKKNEVIGSKSRHKKKPKHRGRRTNKWHKKYDPIIVDMRQKGKTVKEIKAEFGLSVHTIYRILHQHGLVKHYRMRHQY